MLAIKHILVVLDRSLDNNVAIMRGMQLASEQNATLSVATYTYNHACEEGSLSDLEMRHELTSLLLADNQQWAEEQMREFKMPIGTKLTVHWCKHAYQAVNEANIDSTFELVIKSASQHHSLVDRVMQHEDWNLLRHCPAPVLLVKDKHAWEDATILAAIDATSTDPAHAVVNDHIFEFAELLNSQQRYKVHLVNSYPLMSLALASLPDTPIPEDVQQYVIEQHQVACEGYAHRYNVADEFIHVREGEPEDVITAVSDSIGADLIIIGTLPSEGMQAVLLGTTVEHVLDSTSADVLAIRPQDGVGGVHPEQV